MNKYKIKRDGRSVLYLVLAAVLAVGVYLITSMGADQVFNAEGINATSTIEMPDKLIVGGESFGVKFFTKGVVVVGMNDITTDSGSKNPARDAGIQEKDIITKINGIEIESNEQISQIVADSNGQTLEVVYKRDNNECCVSITPVIDQDSKTYKLGVWVRDSTAGIGTITFYDPQNKTFGALGHGICDIDTGIIMPIRYAKIYGAEIHSVKKGESGNPGELKGMFVDSVTIGTLYKNTEEGVFGNLDDCYNTEKQCVDIGRKNEVKEGPATIICTIDTSGAKEYCAEIVKISNGSKQSTKNLLIKVTDPELIKATGGIVQGMSGSPIIQNGKIIGAVTHVLVNEPLMGYGIFIENMLAQMVS